MERKKVENEGRAWNKEIKEEEPEDLQAIFSFFLCLSLKILFCREAILDSWYWKISKYNQNKHSTQFWKFLSFCNTIQFKEN